MPWSMDVESHQRLKQIFSGTLSPNNEERRLANEALNAAREQPEVENYLFSLLVMDNEARSDVRAAAGINLKNGIIRNEYKDQVDRLYLLEHIFEGLMVQDALVRNISGNVITSLFSIYGVEGWPQCLSNLFSLTNSNAIDGLFAPQEAAMSSLCKILEDSVLMLDQEYNGERPLRVMVPNLIKLIDHPHSPAIIALTIHCINQIIPLKTQAFLVCIDDFLSGLFRHASDTSKEIRRKICVSFSLLLENKADKVLPHLAGMIDYCLHLMKTSEEEVALEACEFILSLSTSPEVETNPEVLKSKISELIPELLQKMVYSKEEIFLIELANEKDGSIEDTDENIRPVYAKSKNSRRTASKGGAGDNTGYDSESNDDDDDDNDDEDDAEDELNLWSLRKCSAATLDILSVTYPMEVLNNSLPVLQEKIVSNEWPIREAAILAFGAISKCCEDLANENLPTLIQYLVERLTDAEPRVRQIACWTISKYASWIAQVAVNGQVDFYRMAFEAVAKSCLDQKKVVQEAACSAVLVFIEDSDPSLIANYAGSLIDQFIKCLQVYQRKNLIILYDCLQTFVEALGQEYLTSSSEYFNVLMHPLLEKWQSLEDNDTDLWPLLECMATIAATLGEAFAPHAVSTYLRALKILATCVHQDQESLANPEVEAPEKDFEVTSIDLIDGIIQGLGTHSVELLQLSSSTLMDLLLVCLEDPVADVRQSAYALLGDLAIFAIDISIKPYLRQVIACIVHEINNRSYATSPVYNNAIWALGELSMRMPFDSIKPYMSQLLDLLIKVINSSDSQQTVLENAAICLGRFGINGGQRAVATRLPEFIVQWCSHILYLIENEEKATAFQGMIQIILSDPDKSLGGLVTPQGKANLALLLVCIGNYGEEPSTDLQQLFSQALNGFKSYLGNDWEAQVMPRVDRDTRQYLLQVYGV